MDYKGYFGFYSEKARSSCFLHDHNVAWYVQGNEIVAVTCVDLDPEAKTYLWDDKVYLGKVDSVFATWPRPEAGCEHGCWGVAVFDLNGRLRYKSRISHPNLVTYEYALEWARVYNRVVHGSVMIPMNCGPRIRVLTGEGDAYAVKVAA